MDVFSIVTEVFSKQIHAGVINWLKLWIDPVKYILETFVLPHLPWLSEVSCISTWLSFCAPTMAASNFRLPHPLTYMSLSSQNSQ